MSLQTRPSLFHKKVWESIKGYRDAMNVGYEDWDFWLNCHLHKIPFYGTKEIVLYYRKQPVSMLMNAREHHEKLCQQIFSNYPELFGLDLVDAQKNI